MPALFLREDHKGFVDSDTGRISLNTVLMPVEASVPPLDAFRHAADFAHALNPAADVMLLHVGEELPIFEGLLPHIELRQGPVIDTILSYAGEIGADLIAMPTQGRRGLLDALRGSTTERVLHGSPCPLLASPVAREAQHAALGALEDEIVALACPSRDRRAARSRISRSTPADAGSHCVSLTAGMAFGPSRLAPTTNTPDQDLQPEKPVAAQGGIDADPDVDGRRLAVDVLEIEDVVVREGLVGEDSPSCCCRSSFCSLPSFGGLALLASEAAKPRRGRETRRARCASHRAVRLSVRVRSSTSDRWPERSTRKPPRSAERRLSGRVASVTTCWAGRGRADGGRP